MLDPISKSPGGKAEIPVSINFVDMPDLIVVKVKSIFDFIAIMLFDEGRELIWFDETMLFLYGMAHSPC